MYKIIRAFDGIFPNERHMQTKRSTIKTGLTLEEAQAHCRDPETNSRTATGAKARRISRNNPGWNWADQYEET